MTDRRNNPAQYSSHELKHVLERVGDGLKVRRRRRNVIRVGTGAAAAVLLTLGAVFLLREGPGSIASAGPLRRASGEAIAASTRFTAGEQVAFSDGSSVHLEEESDLLVNRNSPTEFRTELSQGRVRFDVTPAKRRRRWLIQAGGVRVEVVGTRFSVEHSEQWVRVAVERGRVRVTGANVPSEERTLGPGETVQVVHDGGTGELPAASPDGQRGEEASGAVDVMPEVSEDSTVAEAEVPTGAEPNVLARADRLRSQGKHRVAAQLLLRALAENRPRGESAVLALTLGRIQLHSLREPRAAARSFDRAISAGLAPGLREQALARSVQAWASAGNHARALTLARRYMQGLSLRAQSRARPALARAPKPTVNSFLTSGSFCIVFLAAVSAAGRVAAQASSAAGQTPSEADCVVLSDRYSEGEHLRSVLRIELAGLGVALVEEGTGQCVHVAVEPVSESVAVVEFPNGRSRVVDLSTISEELRQRSLALAIAEELSSLRANAPTLRAVPIPTEGMGAEPDLPEEGASMSSPDPSGEPETREEQPTPVAIIAGLAGGRFWGSQQNLFRGRVGAELDLGLGDWGRLRAALEVGHGAKQVDPFGEFSVTLLGASVAWRFAVFEEGPLALLVLPEAVLAGLWLQATPSSRASVSEESAASTALQLNLSVQLQLRLTRSVILELGPTVGGAPVCGRVFGENETLGGVCGVYTGGRVGVVIAL